MSNLISRSWSSGYIIQEAKMDGIRRRIFRRWYTCVYYAGKIHLSRGLVLEMILPAVTLSLHSWYWVIIPVELWIYGLSWRADQLLEERGHLNFDLSANHITEDEHQQAYSRYNKRLEKLRRLVDDTLIFFAVWLVLTLLLRFTHYPLEGITRFSYLAWAHCLGWVHPDSAFIKPKIFSPET